MFYYDKEKTIELSIDYPNYITDSEKLYVLPCLMHSVAKVEIVLTSRAQIIIESPGHPIFYGRHCGSRVHFLGSYGKTIDLNPKFIWSKDRWLLSTYGYAIFAEMEINPEITLNIQN